MGPVLADQLLGLITRRDVDRAFDHGMVDRPLQRIMRAGQVVIHEDAALDDLRSLMAHSGWGQVPVVNDRSEIVGIVTRTDLIRQGEQALSLPFQPREVAHRLEHFLLPEHHHLLRVLGQVAARLDYTIYVVGGFVRDLLLSELLTTGHVRDADMLVGNSLANGGLDVDIVLEGDAIAFAQHVQDHFGGRTLTHRRFGTAKWLLSDPDNPVDAQTLLAQDSDEGPLLQPNALPPSLDFVTARTEFYTAPTALPTVERGSIKLDLYRRDFTINTLAICLNPRRWGELLDFYGGIHDLQRGAIRVLHSLSFVDDPTRMLRAVRYEQRFGFRIESHTLELLRDSLTLLRRVTPVRIVHELERTLLEERPEDALSRLHELGMLAQIHEDLRVNAAAGALFGRLRTALRTWGNEANPLGQQLLHTALRQAPLDRLYWALLMLTLPDTIDQPLAKKLRLRKETQQLVAESRLLQQELSVLVQNELLPSQITAILDQAVPVSIALLGVANGADDGPLLTRLGRYVAEWRDLKPLLNGHDLAALGAPRGPAYRLILEELRTGRLDGALQSRQDEVAFVEHWLAGQ
ncbi:MAG: CBS domain-containing protein [Caldilineaceae bacterium]